MLNRAPDRRILPPERDVFGHYCSSACNAARTWAQVCLVEDDHDDRGIAADRPHQASRHDHSAMGSAVNRPVTDPTDWTRRVMPAVGPVAIAIGWLGADSHGNASEIFLVQHSAVGWASSRDDTSWRRLGVNHDAEHQF